MEYVVVWFYRSLHIQLPLVNTVKHTTAWNVQQIANSFIFTLDANQTKDPICKWVVSHAQFLWPMTNLFFKSQYWPVTHLFFSSQYWQQKFVLPVRQH